jgi:hypothetical protein
MRVLTAFLLLSVLLAQASAQQKKSDRDRDGLVGPVYQVNEKLSQYFSNFYIITTYSLDGDLIKIDAPYGNFHVIKTFKRINENTVLMRYIDVGASNTGQLALAPLPLKDKDGAELYTFHYRDNGVYKRNGDRLILEATHIQESVMTGDRLVWRVFYLLDPQNRLTEKVEVHAHDLKTKQTIYKYDSLSIRAPQYVEHRVDGLTTGTQWFSYEFDDKGNWVKRTRVKEEPAIASSPPNDVTTRTIIYYPSK